MTLPDEWLTISQAAQRLGVAERQARRFADRLPDACRTVDRTPAGRKATRVLWSALREIAQPPPSAGHLPDAAPDSLPDSDRTEDKAIVPISVALTAQRDALERVIAEQAARIGDLQAALDHERAQASSLNDALARAQVLRALPPPEAAETATFWQWLGFGRKKSVQGSGEDGVK